MKINTMCLIEALTTKAHLKPIGKNNLLGKNVGMVFIGSEPGFPSRCVFKEVCGESSELDFYHVNFTFEGQRLFVVLNNYLEITEIDVGNYLNVNKLAEIGIPSDMIKTEEEIFAERKQRLEAMLRYWLPSE